jgi:hypothetical protein
MNTDNRISAIGDEKTAVHPKISVHLCLHLPWRCQGLRFPATFQTLSEQGTTSADLAGMETGPTW